MCGIAGAFGPVSPSPPQLAATLAALRHRGPDASGVCTSTLNGYPITLAHTRLAIIDLDPRSNQPMRRDDLALAFNGELYNYKEVRAELLGLGHEFKTASDTEVVLCAYRQWAETCVERFEGMWALALVDHTRGRLWLSRDRFGEKPLFTYWFGETLYFASEIKGLIALTGRRLTPSSKQVRRYLAAGYRSLFMSSGGFYEDVQEIPSASSAVFEKPHSPRPRKYWSVRFQPDPKITLSQACDGVREHLLRALEIRLRADVPLAFCLSGGIDSGTLAGMAAKQFGAEVHGFTIVDDDERYDESVNAAQVVEHLRCRHTIVRTTRDRFWERMALLVADHDAPVATISYYIHSFLSEAIRDAGYKIAISGTGADELFSGYYDHYNYWIAQMAREGGDATSLVEGWRDGYGAFVTNPALRDPMTFSRNPEQRSHLQPERATFSSLLGTPFEEPFVEQKFCDDILRNRMMNELVHEVVPVLLREDDLNSMRVSIENRSPYLDSELAEFMSTVPTRHLVADGAAKALLRMAAEGFLAEPVRRDKRKRGFNASILSLVDVSDAETRDRLLASGPIFDIVDRVRFEEMLDGSFASNEMSKFLFSFVSARIFLDQSSHPA